MLFFSFHSVMFYHYYFSPLINQSISNVVGGRLRKLRKYERKLLVIANFLDFITNI